MTNEDVDWDAMENEVGDSILQQVITPLQMRNRIVRDVAPCPLVLDVQRLLDMPLSSPDAAQMEHTESHSRLDAIAVLGPTIEMMSGFAAQAAAGSIMVDEGMDDPAALEELVSKTAPVVYMSVVSIIAEFVDAGYLHLPHGVQMFEMGGGSE